MKIDLLGGSYQHKYLDLNSQQCVNWYSVTGAQIEKSKEPHVKFPTPGLEIFTTITGNKVRGLHVSRDLTSNRLFAVVDDTLYEIGMDTTVTSRGALTNGTGSTLPIYMATNTIDEMIIIDGGSSLTYSDGYAIITNNGSVQGYIFNLSTNTLTAIADADFPNTAADIGRVYFSEANNFSSWLGASVFTPTFRADPTLAVCALREDIICFGAETAEAYINDGSTPFSRLQRTTQYCGILAPHSAAQFNDGIAFLGRTDRGEPKVYIYTKDYQVMPISPPSINYRLSTAATLEDCLGMAEESKDGHIFYYLSIPSLETTFVYDLTTQEWHERKSKRPYSDANGQVHEDQFRGRCMANFNGLHLFGDRYSGKIFIQKYDVFTEDGLTITRLMRSPIYNEEQKYISVNSLEVDYNSGYGALSGQGSTPYLLVSISKDGGLTYTQPQQIDVGIQGRYDKRCKINNLGTGRNWVIELKLTDPIDFMLGSAVAHGNLGVF